MSLHLVLKNHVMWFFFFFFLSACFFHYHNVIEVQLDWRIHISAVCSFGLVNRISLLFTSFHNLFILLLVDEHLDFPPCFWLLWIKLSWTFLYKSLWGHTFLLLLGRLLATGLLCSTVTLCLAFFPCPKWVITDLLASSVHGHDSIFVCITIWSSHVS